MRTFARALFLFTCIVAGKSTIEKQCEAAQGKSRGAKRQSTLQAFSLLLLRAPCRLTVARAGLGAPSYARGNIAMQMTSTENSPSYSRGAIANPARTFHLDFDDFFLTAFHPTVDESALMEKVAKLKTAVFDPDIAPHRVKQQENNFLRAMLNKKFVIAAFPKGRLAEQMLVRGGLEHADVDSEGPDAVGAADMIWLQINKQWLAGYITNVCVHPNARRLGIARRIMEMAELRVREKGGRLIAMHVDRDNEAAIRLYIGLGYEFNNDATLRTIFSTETFIDPNDDPPQLIMVKELN